MSSTFSPRGAQSMRRGRRAVLAALVAAAAATPACRRQAAEARPESHYPATHPRRTDTVLTHTYVAQIRAIQHIELRALERGYVQQVFVDEGQRVARGTKMFQILPAIYQAELQRAAAEADLADIEYANTRALGEKNVVSQSEVAMARAKANRAKAEVQLATTRRTLTEIRAPFDGLSGRFHVRVGSLVDEGDELTTLSDNGTMWVYFNVSEAEYLLYMAHHAADAHATVKLMMANGEVYGRDGRVEVIEADFNNQTGNIAFRAAFPNPEGLLRHGETGSVLMSVPVKDALLIPQKATFDVLDRKFVFVVDAKHVVHSRPIEVAGELPHLFLVRKGLTEGDTILVEGLRQVSDGATVEIREPPPDELYKSLQVPAE